MTTSSPALLPLTRSDLRRRPDPDQVLALNQWFLDLCARLPLTPLRPVPGAPAVAFAAENGLPQDYLNCELAPLPAEAGPHDLTDWHGLRAVAAAAVAHGSGICLRCTKDDPTPVLFNCGDLAQYLVHGQLGPLDPSHNYLWLDDVALPEVPSIIGAAGASHAFTREPLGPPHLPEELAQAVGHFVATHLPDFDFPVLFFEKADRDRIDPIVTTRAKTSQALQDPAQRRALNCLPWFFPRNFLGMALPAPS